LGAQRDDPTLEPLTLKWPNDLQWHGAKLAGLLIETAPCSTVVVGMGLNLRGATALSTQLGRDIADLAQIEHAYKRSIHPAHLVAHVAQAWQHALLDYAANGYTAFTHSFDIVDALAGQSVQVMDQGNILHQGIAQGTDSLGRLCVMTETGLVPVLVGDISIRPAHPFKGTP
jgi:BirA family biotin operon repressor/biotin-[acetyl-CoA-carboxylase] ligase